MFLSFCYASYNPDCKDTNKFIYRDDVYAVHRTPQIYIDVLQHHSNLIDPQTSQALPRSISN